MNLEIILILLVFAIIILTIFCGVLLAASLTLASNIRHLRDDLDNPFDN